MTDHDELLRLIAAARRQGGDAGRSEAIGRQHDLGKLTARERLALLLDEGSLAEFGGLATIAADSYAGVPGDSGQSASYPGDGVVAGTGRIAGRPVAVAAYDFTVFGGSAGVIGQRKVDRAMEVACSARLPLVLLLDGGGHRIQDGLDSAVFAAGGRTLALLSRLSGWVPVVALLLGPGYAGNTNMAAFADLVVMRRGAATMGIAGPALVAAATGEQVDNETLGGADAQVASGVAHLAVDTEEQAFTAAAAFLSYLPRHADEAPPPGPGTDLAERQVPELLQLVPADLRRGYDVRPVIAAIADDGLVLEQQPRYARNIVTAFSRLAGRPVGMIANQPLVLAGTLDAPACEKAARFVSLCDAFGLPLIFLIDVPGVLVGTAAERSGIARRSARLAFELGRASVPRMSVVLRKGYGMAYTAMCGGRGFDPELAVAWPSAEICAMNIDGAVDIAYRKVIAAAPDPAQMRAEIIAYYRTQIGPLEAAAGFGIDDVIDPADTRRVLAGALAIAPLRRPAGIGLRTRGISPV